MLRYEETLGFVALEIKAVVFYDGLL